MCLADGDGEAWADWKLQKLERVRAIEGDEWDYRNEDWLSFPLSSHDAGFDDVYHQLLDNESCPTAQLRRIKVAQQHDWAAEFEVEVVWRQTRRF